MAPKSSPTPMPPTNPFDSDAVENFPPFTPLFENSPSIDTIARTKPVEFSLHGSLQSSAAGSSARPRTGLSERSPRDPARPRVAKQLNFSVPAPSSRERRATRSMAAAAGWPTHAIGAQQLVHDDVNRDAPDVQGEGGGAGGSDIEGPALACQPPITADIAAAPRHETSACDGSAAPKNPHVDGAAAEGAAAIVHEMPIARNAFPPAAKVATEIPVDARCRTGLPARELLRTRSVGVAPLREGPAHLMGRSPSAPVLPQRSSSATVTDTGAKAARPLSAELNEARRALLEPASYEFTQYLRNLWRRWPQRPLVRSRLDELGLSPPRTRAAERPTGDVRGYVGTPPAQYWQPPPERAIDSTVQSPTAFAHYPFWAMPVPMPIMLPAIPMGQPVGCTPMSPFSPLNYACQAPTSDATSPVLVYPYRTAPVSSAWPHHPSSAQGLPAAFAARSALRRA